MINNISIFDTKSIGTSPIALFNNDRIVYANSAFARLYQPLKKGDKTKTKQLLSRLSSKLVQSDKKVLKAHVELIPSHGKKEIIVCLLNKFGAGKNWMSLVIAREKNIGGLLGADPTQLKKGADEPPFFNPGRSVGFDNSPKVKLSSVFSRLIGEDIYFKAVLFKAQKASQSDYPILITGETGTGKEILANMIHRASRRRDKKFVDINCAAIPEQLIDSELFGYEKGAFTGALPGGRHGLFVEANHGTFFLDEIADASLATQAKLLRVLNEGYFKRVGGTKNIEVDVRIISATNKTLPQLIEDEHFRQDLMYRLNTITINLPPLRERSGDVTTLANYFLELHSKKTKQILKFSTACFQDLEAYHWPGNVRELKGVIDYMVTMATGSIITQNHFPDFLQPQINTFRETSQTTSFNMDDDANLLSKAVENAERQVIKEVLHRAKNKSKAIKILGTSRRTFYSKLKQYNLQ